MLSGARARGAGSGAPADDYGTVYFNGDPRPVCLDAGPHLHDREMRHVYRGAVAGPGEAAMPADFPLDDPFALDTGFAPDLEEQPEGVAALHHLRGWTILAFWDRSGDLRGNSNSAFVIRGKLDFEAAVAASQEAFPEIWARFYFAVVPEG